MTLVEQVALSLAQHWWRNPNKEWAVSVVEAEAILSLVKDRLHEWGMIPQEMEDVLC